MSAALFGFFHTSRFSRGWHCRNVAGQMSEI